MYGKLIQLITVLGLCEATLVIYYCVLLFISGLLVSEVNHCALSKVPHIAYPLFSLQSSLFCSVVSLSHNQHLFGDRVCTFSMCQNVFLCCPKVLAAVFSLTSQVCQIDKVPLWLIFCVVWAWCMQSITAVWCCRGEAVAAHSNRGWENHRALVVYMSVSRSLYLAVVLSHAFSACPVDQEKSNDVKNSGRRRQVCERLKSK